ncbi:hypothetical protein AMS68_002748 [Peltaster fructicola]|uniref:Anaphase-promoting complex subunit 4 WD40 domain-containing protein n=1 Tax=Peltaster fructicola TaxID=286661 RepID=A0A6H0XRE8_9PEZI|nr:hypothetical protein AMS68_002748 [Peltaster fructicola]
MSAGNGRMSIDPYSPAETTSAPASVAPGNSSQFQSPRRGHIARVSEDLRLPSNAPPLQYGQQYQGTPMSYRQPPTFNLQQPDGSPAPQSVPGALQPAGGNLNRPVPSSGYSAPHVAQVPSIQTNAQQYTTQSTPRLHSRNDSMDRTPSTTAQKYMPFAQTPSQTPTSSNPKHYNALSSHTPVGPSHSPLNLGDIRSRTISDANELAMGTNTLFSYSDTATNSNYLAPFATYAFDWCKWPIHGGGDGAGKMAIGSYLEDPHNFIQILDTKIVPQEVKSSGQSPYGLEYTKVAEATCAYPVTRILWEPPSQAKTSTDLLATSGDHLRLWSLPPATSSVTNNINSTASVNTRDPTPQKLQPLALLSNSKTPEHTAPLTSLDWNRLSPKLIITSSIDTTCTIWDIPTLTAKTQLIAHDKEVFDVRFCAGSVDVFVSCGADGSVRMFDLRSLEHSTIIYEPAEKSDKCECLVHALRNANFLAASPSASSPTKLTASTMPAAPPLLRLAASPHDAHLLATFASDSNLIRILDVRQPGTALLELRGHAGNLNSIEWSPHRRGLLASGADDSQVLIWDLLNQQNQASLVAGVNGTGNGAGLTEKGPYASWRCEYEVANVSWAPESLLTSQGGDWIGVCAGRGVWGVKI